MSKATPELRILDDVYNIGFSNGLNCVEDIHISSLLQNLCLLPQFNEDGYDLMIEYNNGYDEGKYTRTLDLLKEE